MTKETVQGLVRIRTGRSGGAFVQRPDGDSVADSVSLLSTTVEVPEERSFTGDP